MGFFTFFYLKRNLLKDQSKTKIFNELALTSGLFLIVPFILSLVSLIWAKSCPIIDGIIFYSVITIPAPIIGAALGAVGYSFSKTYGYFFFVFMFMFIAVIPVFEIYLNPQIYCYNPLIGFFPGTIYDEAIEVDFKLAAYRIINVLFFGSLFYSIIKAILSGSKFLLTMVWICAIIAPTAFLLFSSDFGYSTTSRQVYKALDKAIYTDNFEIHYSSKMNDTLINVIALNHEFYFSELQKFFQLKPVKKIRSLIFLNNEQKRDLFGTENADVAKPWIPEIYITAENYDKTLKHEIAHCFTAEFGNTVFKLADNFNPALIEGIAMAADPEYDSYDLDYMAALAFFNNFEIDLKELFYSFNFFKQPSSLSYVIAGSFIKFLIEKFGIENFKNLYTDLDFEKYYNKEISVLSNDYTSYLTSKFTFDSASVHRAKYYFGRKAIFYKDCPRYIAKKIKQGWKLFEESEIEDAKISFQDALKSGKNYSAVLGLAYCYSELKQFKQAIAFLNTYIPSFQNSAYWYELQLALADIYAKSDDIHEADSIYNILASMNPNRTIYSLCKLRSDLIGLDSLLAKYLNGKNNEKLKVLQFMNYDKYNYSSLPILIQLAKIEQINYPDFLANFSKVFIVNDDQSSYSLYKLSQFMSEKMDFDRARKLAALASRFYDKSFSSILENNLKKMNWLFKKSSNLLLKFVYK